MSCVRADSKKKTLIASEQDRPDVVEKRVQWHASQPAIDPNRVVFIDASVKDEPGRVRERWLKPDCCTSDAMVHCLEPRELLAWCLETYGSAPEAVLITVGGHSFEIGETLSREVSQALPDIVRRTLDLLR